MNTVFPQIAAWSVRHAKTILALAGLFAIAAATIATQLPTDAATDTLVDSDTASYRATQEVRRDFGEEPVVVLAEGDLQRIVLTANLGRLLRLEGCLSGKVPNGAKPIPGPCAELAKQDPVRSLVGPATFLNEATIQVQRELERLVATVPPEQAARTAASDRGAVRDHQRAEPLESRLPRRDRLRYQPVAGDAEGEARLPLPEQGLGADHPAPPLRPERF